MTGQQIALIYVILGVASIVIPCISGVLVLFICAHSNGDLKS